MRGMFDPRCGRSQMSRLAGADQGIAAIMSEDAVVIVPYQDGPYLIRGAIELRDQWGQTIPTNRRTIALCRCGKSKTRPFCDGTHHVVKFRASSSPDSPAGAA